MNSQFDQMPDESRIWIYQSNRRLTHEEGMALQITTNQFISGWNAHGHILTAGFEFLFNHFLVLSVDESVQVASGCSIDTSVALVRQLNDTFGVDFLDRTKIATKVDEEVVLFELAAINGAVETGKLTSESLVFNNLCPTLGEFRSNWLVPASQTWLKRYFN